MSWWLGVPPAQAVVRCGGAAHRLRWEAGALRALDHADPEGERALAALGGERCACVDALDAWERHAADPRVLVLGPRGPLDTIAPAPEPFPGDPPDALDDLAALLRLGGGMPERLVATVAAALAGRRAEPLLQAAVYGRALAAVRGWHGVGESLPEIAVVDGAATLSAQDGRVRAALPFAWLLDVWARGLATVLGRFCLAARTEDGREFALSVVAPDFRAPEELRLTIPA